MYVACLIEKIKNAFISNVSKCGKTDLFLIIFIGELNGIGTMNWPCIWAGDLKAVTRWRWSGLAMYSELLVEHAHGVVFSRMYGLLHALDVAI